MKDIVEFVEVESAKRSDPIFGDLLTPNTRFTGVHGQTGSKVADNAKPSKGQHFATAVDKKGENKVSSKLRCPKCTDSHFLNQCSQFRASTVDDRLKFVRSKNLCENCFMYGHFGDACSRNWTCNVEGCGRKHTGGCILHV